MTAFGYQQDWIRKYFFSFAVEDMV